MNPSVLLAVVTSLITLGLPISSARAEPATGELTQTQMQADFDLMRKALEEAHAGLYRYSTKAEIDRQFDAQRARLNNPLPKTAFEAVVAESLALIRCGHTKMKPAPETESAIRNARTFPLRVLLEGNHLMVAQNDSANDQTIRPGMEILEINGHKAEDILARFWSVIAADGDIQTGKRHDISGRFSQFYWWRVEQAGTFKITARSASGNSVSATLGGVTDQDRKTNQNPVNAPMQASIGKLMGWSRENHALRFLKDPQIAEIRLRYFVGNDFPGWIENTFKTLKDKGTTSLIIDLRGNGGGDDMYGALLVSYLTDKPFRYFDHIDIKSITPSFKEQTDWNADETRLARLRDGLTPNPAGGFLVIAGLHKGVAEHQPAKTPFLGKIFVIIDGGTFSTAADFCAVVHHLQRATFIGEETAGGYYGNNSGMEINLTLPNSKIAITIPMYQYWNAVPGYASNRRGTVPDHAVELRTADLLQGVDAALDLAVTLSTPNGRP